MDNVHSHTNDGKKTKLEWLDTWLKIEG